MQQYFLHCFFSLSIFIFVVLEMSLVANSFSSPQSASSSSPPTAVTGRIALVTGSNKGVGKEICRLLSKDPAVAATILACRSLERGQAAIRELEADGGQNLFCVEYDILASSARKAGGLSNDKGELTTAAAHHVHDYIASKFGRLDILINNAAICFNDPTLYGTVDFTPFEQQARITIETNFGGSWRLTQACLPLLQKSATLSTSTTNVPRPRIINVASYAGRLSILKTHHLVEQFTASDLTMDQLEGLTSEFVTAVENGTHGRDGWPNTCYGVSKLAIIAMTRVLARTYESEILCHSIDPGYCATDQNNNQGNRPAARGAVTPYKLAMISDDGNIAIDGSHSTGESNHMLTGLHWFDEEVMEW